MLGVGGLGTNTQPGIAALSSSPLILWVQIAMIHGQLLLFFLQKDDLGRKKKSLLLAVGFRTWGTVRISLSNLWELALTDREPSMQLTYSPQLTCSSAEFQE